MASGVAIVSTRVGQAMDLIRHQENGWLVDVEDVSGLAKWSAHLLRNGAPPAVLTAAQQTAAANRYEQQLPLWDRLFDGFVERSPA
jgi:glycosyltransferase involved in cell wall biosynthesis